MAEVPVELARALTIRYRLERELGRGGMATVYLARDVRHHRPVALKVLRSDLAAALGRERFLREIQIAARLSHPHILSLHDSGSSGAFLYYVMPVVEGESLRARLEREGQLRLDDALAIAGQVAEALDYAHGQGVVHRDIKPENILLTGDHAVVADFGIARAVTAAGGEKLTATGIAVGTPAYMSPEQWSGDPRLDGRADIYALGCVVYEMLAGTPPFTGPNAQAIMARHSVDVVPPLRTVRRAVPPQVELAVLKALEKSPADRFASASAFVSALRAPEAPAAVAARRRWLVATAVALGMLGLAAAGFAWASYTGRPGTLIGAGAMQQGDRVVLGDFANHTEDSTIALAVREALRATLDDPRLVRLVTASQIGETLERMGRQRETPLAEPVSQEVAERISAKAYITGEVTRLGRGFQLIARISSLDGREVRTERVVARSEDDVIAAIDRLGSALRRDIGESLRSALQRPPLYRATSRSLSAVRALSAAVRAEYMGGAGDPVALARQAVALDTGFATAYMQLGAILAAHGFAQESQQAMAQAFRRRKGLPEVERLPIEWAYYLYNDSLTEAEAALQQYLNLDPLSTFALQNLAAVRNVQRRFAEAESLAMRAIYLDNQNHENAGPVAYANALSAQLAQGRVQAADSLVARIPPGPGPLRRLELDVALGKRDWERARAVADSFAGPGLRGRLRVIFDLVHGRLRAAERGWGNQPVYMAPLAVLRYTADTARALRLLARWQKSVGWDTMPAARREYAWPLAVSAEAGRVRQARELLQEWQRSPDGPGSPWKREWGIAEIALAEGHVDSAVTAYLAWSRLPVGDLNNQGLAEAGMALDRAGHTDSAIVLYERSLAERNLGAPRYESSWYPIVLYRLGILHESLGHRDQARDYYSRFIDLWKDADPELQPRVREARDHLARLSRESGGSP